MDSKPASGLGAVIRKHALKNAFDFGRANVGAVAGKVISEFSDSKKDMKSTMQMINAAISEVNKLSKAEVEKELSKYEFIEKKKEEKKGLEVPNAQMGGVVTRFPPEPSGYPHIGHAKASFLDYEVAKQYEGKMVLRFDDTNPEKESQEYVDAIKEGLKWLGIEWARESYTSDNMRKIYECAEKLIRVEKAYACTCKQDEISKLRAEMKACACRNASVEKNLLQWNAMNDGEYAEGQAILRFKGDLKSLNTVMRDPALARIISKSHYRQGTKYRVWPGYDLAVCIMDFLEGITHSMRTKEYELRDELYFEILRSLGLNAPTLIEFSRLEIKNAPISKRLLTPLVKEGKVLGWDDPRLPTLAGLKRRGIMPEAIRNFVLSFGISKVESEPTWERLLVENRKLVDPVSKHYFFVPNPVKVKIAGAQETVARLKLGKGMGTREISVKGVVYIQKTDADAFEKDEIFRLKDLYNVGFKEKKGDYLVCDYEGGEVANKKVQWVSEENMIECEIMAPKDLLDDKGEYKVNSLEIIKGYCEKNCIMLSEGEIIQFERFGFCRLDKKTKDKLHFIYTC